MASAVSNVAVARAVNLTLIISELPSCALDCIITGLESSSTGITDPVSTCTNTTLQASLSACVQKSSCNYTQQLTVQSVNDELCLGQPIESRTEVVRIVGLALGIPTLIAIVLRCCSRYQLTKKLGLDDVTILAAGAVLIGIMVADILNARHGLGLHYWNVDPKYVIPLSQTFYASEVLYLAVLILTKISILLFYLRVFPARKFRVITLALLAFVVTSGVIFTFLVIFQCWPISGIWDKAGSGRCFNLNAVAFSSSGFSIAQDILIVLLPVPELMKLKMSRKKKLNLMFMFGLGSFACITSIIRLKFLVDFGASTDPTWDNVIPASWSMAEICVGIICTCLPAIRALLAGWFPRFFDINYTDRPSKPSSKQSSKSSKTTASKVSSSAKTVPIHDDDGVLLERLENKSQSSFQYGKSGGRFVEAVVGGPRGGEGRGVSRGPSESSDVEADGDAPRVEYGMWDGRGTVTMI